MTYFQFISFIKQYFLQIVIILAAIFLAGVLVYNVWQTASTPYYYVEIASPQDTIVLRTQGYPTLDYDTKHNVTQATDLNGVCGSVDGEARIVKAMQE
jgi:hypothetical protein